MFSPLSNARERVRQRQKRTYLSLHSPSSLYKTQPIGGRCQDAEHNKN